MQSIHVDDHRAQRRRDRHRFQPSEADGLIAAATGENDVACSRSRHVVGRGIKRAAVDDQTVAGSAGWSIAVEGDIQSGDCCG